MDSLIKLRKLLSDEICIKLLSLSEQGLSLKSEKLQGFSKRKMNSRIKDLLNLGLVKTVNDSIKLTDFGKIIYYTQIRFSEELFQLREKVLTPVELEPKDILDINRALTGDYTILIKLIRLQRARSMWILTNYEKLVQDLSQGIKNSKEEVALATRYNDATIVKELIKSAERGIKIRVLSDFGLLLKRSHILHVSKESDINRYYTLLQPFQGSKIEHRYSYIPLSYVVIDQRLIGIEILNPLDPEVFFMGIKAESKTIANLLLKTFEDQWMNGTNNIRTILRMITAK